MRCLTEIKGKTRRYRIGNEEVRKDIVEESVRQRVQKARLRWYGHVKN